MGSPRTSEPFPGFDSMYSLNDPGSPRPFVADVEVQRTEALEIVRAEKRPHLVEARWTMGTRIPGDVIWTTLAALVILSERVLAVLEGFTGWSSYPVRLLGKEGEEIAGYRGLAVHGRCGPIDTSKSVQVHKEFPGGTFPIWRGLLFEPDTWDGSDIFMPEGDFGFVFIRKVVKDTFTRARVRNISFARIDEIESNATAIEVARRSSASKRPRPRVPPRPTQ